MKSYFLVVLFSLSLFSTSAIAAGSGGFWVRSTSDPAFPAIRVDVPGPVMLTVTSKYLNSSIGLTITDSAGTTVYANSALTFSTSYSQTISFNASTAGTYRLRLANTQDGRFKFGTSAGHLVMPAGVTFNNNGALGYPRKYYFFVPQGTTSFAARLEGVYEGSPDGPAYNYIDAPDHSIHRQVAAGVTSTVTVPPGLDGAFWTIIVGYASDARFYLTGVPPAFAESESAWFDPDGLAQPPARAGSGTLWYRSDSGSSTPLMNFRVDTPGPVTVTFTQPPNDHKFINVTILDPAGATAYQEYSCCTDFITDDDPLTGQVSFNASSTGRYQLRIGNLQDGRFTIASSVGHFVLSSGVDFEGAPGYGTYYFFVPARTTLFVFRLQVPNAGNSGTAKIFAPDGTLRQSVSQSGSTDVSYPIDVENAASGAFWRVDLTHSGDIRPYLSGVPSFFAESPDKWFDATFAHGSSQPFDFDGNGRSDIFWRNEATGRNGIWLMNGTTLIDARNPLTAEPKFDEVFSGDFNGDGIADVLWHDSVAGITGLWLMNGSTITAGVRLSPQVTTYTIAGVGDFNGDDKADIFWRDPMTGKNQIWLMDGTTPTTMADIGSAEPRFTFSGVRDFDGDGRADVLWRDTSTGANALWLMNGTAFLAENLPGADPEFRVAGIGDFNGDAHADIAWRNPATGRNSIWLMNGTRLLDATNISGCDPAFTVARVKDFDGDGKSDFLWRNQRTGLNGVWLMNGTAIADAVNIRSCDPAMVPLPLK